MTARRVPRKSVEYAYAFLLKELGFNMRVDEWRAMGNVCLVRAVVYFAQVGCEFILGDRERHRGADAAPAEARGGGGRGRLRLHGCWLRASVASRRS